MTRRYISVNYSSVEWLRPPEIVLQGASRRVEVLQASESLILEVD